MADRVAIVDGGRVLQVGTPRDLYERASARAQSRRFVGHSTLLRGRVTAHDTVDVRFATLRVETGGTDRAPRSRCWCGPSTGGRSAGARRELHRRRAGRRALLRATQRYDFIPAGSADPCAGRPRAATRRIAIDPRHRSAAGRAGRA